MNPFSHSQPVRSDADFFGRRELLDELVSSRESFVVLGEEKSGKTSLLQQLDTYLQTSAAVRRPGSAMLLDLADPSLGTPESFFHNVADRIKLHLQEVYGNVLGKQTSGAMDGATGILQTLHECNARGLHTSLVLLLDNLDEPVMGGPRLSVFQGLRLLIEDCPAGNEVRVLGTSGVAFLSAERVPPSPLRDKLRQVVLPPLDSEALKALVDRLLRHPRIGGLQAAVVDHLHAATGGQPYLSQRILHEVYDRATCDEDVLPTLRACIERTTGRNADLFTRWLRKTSLEEDTFLRALASARKLPTEGWALSDSSAMVFESAQVARVHLDSQTEYVSATCGAFFDWLSKHVDRLAAFHTESASARLRGASVRTVLAGPISRMLQQERPGTDQQLADLVRVALSAYGHLGPRTPRAQAEGKDSPPVLLDGGMAILTRVLPPKESTQRIAGRIRKEAEQARATYQEWCFLLCDPIGRGREISDKAGLRKSDCVIVNLQEEIDGDLEVG